MADAPTNSVTANAAIVAMYPEISGISAFIDSLAATGRKRFVVTLEDDDHGPAIEEKLKLDLTGQGYTITRKASTVTIAF